MIRFRRVPSGVRRAIGSAEPCSRRPKEYTVDMNELFYHHQMALIAAVRSGRAGRHRSNFDLPGHYARRIDDYRVHRGMPTYFAKAPSDASIA